MKFYILMFALISIAACNKKNLQSSEKCTAVVDDDCVCLQIYAPVCGCDKVTYPNSCYAECATIMTYTEGECP